MIAYKVVHEKTRYGSNAGMFIDLYGLKYFDELLEEYKNLKEFFPVYNINEKIKCKKGSIGLMCFEQLSAAHIFTNRYIIRNSLQIIEVDIDQKNIMRDHKIIMGCGSYIKNLLTKNSEEYECYSPIGTIFVKELKVLT